MTELTCGHLHKFGFYKGWEFPDKLNVSLQDYCYVELVTGIFKREKKEVMHSSVTAYGIGTRGMKLNVLHC
jgi:hypothetical protein